MLKKKIIALFILGISFVGITNAEILTGNGNTRLTMDNTEIDVNQVRIPPVTAGQNNGYIVTYKGNANRTVTDEGTFNNIMQIKNTNRNAYRTWYLWNVDNEIVFSMGGNDNWFNGNAVKPLKVLKSTPSEYMGVINNNTLYTHDISELYTNNGNVTELSFGVSSDRNNYQTITDDQYRYMCITFDEQDTYCTACKMSQNNTNCYGGQTTYLESNVIYNYTYSDYEQYIGTSPFNGGGTGGTGEETTGGAKPYCPPIRFEIDMYGYKYNTGLCYSNTEEISGGQVTTVTPISIFDAFPTYQNYVQAYNLITNNCHTDTVNTVEQCQTALQGIGKKPSEILLKVINSNIQEGVSLSKIYQYCHLQLNFTEEEKRNTSTCNLKEEGTYYATGVNSTTQSNPNPLQGMTDVLKNSTDIIIPEDGTIFDSILPDGVISWKDVIFDFNFWEHLTQLIGKMIILFKVRPIQTGILPPLITSLLLLVILFKIYKK